jgi:hypothetical protein
MESQCKLLERKQFQYEYREIIINIKTDLFQFNICTEVIQFFLHCAWNAYRSLVLKFPVKHPRQRPGRRREDKIKMTLREIACEDGK